MLSVEMISRQNRCHYVYKGGNMMRRILHIVLITALMFLNVMYTFEAVKAAEPQQPISIEKAIQQKEGQALVEGYAVGQAVSPQHYKLTSPFQMIIMLRWQTVKTKHRPNTSFLCKSLRLQKPIWAANQSASSWEKDNGSRKA